MNTQSFAASFAFIRKYQVNTQDFAFGIITWYVYHINHVKYI